MHTHPPVDFALYGLPSSWAGPRWLEFVEGRAGDPVWATWLAHTLRGRPEAWCLVGTLPSDRIRPALAVAGGEPIDREVAFTAARWLVGLTDPGKSLDEAASRRYQRNSGPFLDEQADALRTWSPATWSVDNQEVKARVLRWTGAWAGLTADLVNAAVVVIAHGLSATDLSLVRADPSAYHFAIESPITYPNTLDLSRATGDGHLPTAGTWPLHLDHARLIAT